MMNNLSLDYRPQIAQAMYSNILNMADHGQPVNPRMHYMVLI